MALDLETLVIQIEANTRDVDSKLRLLQSSVNDSMAGVESRTNSFKNTFESHFASISRITRNFTAGFAILETIRFGENIVQNFDKITATAREYGVVVDQSVILKMNEAAVATTRAWTTIQVAAAPALASISTGLANIVSNLFGIPGDLDRLTNSLRAAQAVAERGAGTSAGKSAAARVADLQAQIASLKEPENIAAANANFTGTNDLREKILRERKKLADENAASEQAGWAKQTAAAEKAANERASVLRALDETDKFLNDEKVKRFVDGIKEQMAAEDKLTTATERLNDVLQKQKDQILVNNVDEIAKSLEPYARLEQQQTRMWERFKDNAAESFAAAITGAQSFGDALKSLAQDLERMLVEKLVTKPLFAALFGAEGSSGSGLFGSLLGSIGLSGALAGGGPVSAGSSYLVGEKGAEIFQPKVPGTIYPNGSGPGGAGDMHFQIIVNGPNGDAQIRAMVAQGVQQGISTYDRHGLPGRVSQLVSDPGTYRLRR